MRKIILLLVVMFSFIMLSACNNDTTKALGDTFEFDGLEITLAEELGFTRLRSRWSDHDGAYVFYIPVVVKNIGNDSNGLDDWLVTIFEPEGRSVESLWMDFEETNIFAAGSIQPGAEKEGNIYILYAEDGEYTIEFNDFSDETIEVVFEVEFDFDAVPEIQTEFSLGETLVVEDVEITFGEKVSWGLLRSTWSDLDGEYYFYLPVSVTNIGDSTNSFPFGVTVFGPGGLELERVAGVIDADDITRSGDIAPGATLAGYMHILYTEDGEYKIEFQDFELGDDLQVFLDIEFDPTAIPEIQTEFSLGETFEFDDLEITIFDDFSWGVISNSWSDLYGEEYFYLPVTVTNIGDSTNSFPWNFTIFGPDGVELANVARGVEGDDISRSGDIRPDVTLEGYIHVLFDGNGEYVIEFSRWSDDDIQVIFQVEG